VNLTIKEITDYVSSFSYKPGWSLAIYAPGEGYDIADLFSGRQEKNLEAGVSGHRLTMTLTVLDSLDDRQGSYVALVIDFPVPQLLRNRTELLQWVLSCVLELEAHEAREWLKVGDSTPFDPHQYTPVYNLRPEPSELEPLRGQF